MTDHDLKTINPYFQDLWDDKKTFELRKNDRDYKEGDLLTLREFVCSPSHHTGRIIKARVTHILRKAEMFGLKSGHVIMSIKVIAKIS